MGSCSRRNEKLMAAKKHPGFDKVSDKIAKKQGISQKSADAILAASSRGASKKAKRRTLD
jgi:hypothetical protein